MATTAGRTPTARASARLVELHGIEHVPESERHGSPRDQFTLWFGANVQVTALVDGALAVVFGAHPLWAVVGLLLGNAFGGAVMALHSAQGPRLGLPQMISSRAQFGVLGAVVPLVLVIVMYLGFAATGTVLAGQAIDALLHVDTAAVGILVFGLLTAIVASVGHDLIHRLGRVSTVVGALGFGYLFVRVLTTQDVGAAVSSPTFGLTSFLLAVSLGAGWQLTYGPYVADYSRYLPTSTPAARVFTLTFLGTVLGSMVSMTLGVLVAAVAGDAFLDNQVGFLGELAGPAAAAAVVYLVIAVGKLTVNCLNAYGTFVCGVTIASGVRPGIRVTQRTRTAVVLAVVAVSVAIALGASADFLSNFKNFVLLILMVFTPWSAINLVDYYLRAHGRVDLDALFDPTGRYGRWNVGALAAYAIGIAVQVPFLSQTLYTGPVAAAMDGADVSWIVGLVVTAPVYLLLTRSSARPFTG